MPWKSRGRSFRATAVRWWKKKMIIIESAIAKSLSCPIYLKILINPLDPGDTSAVQLIGGIRT